MYLIYLKTIVVICTRFHSSGLQTHGRSTLNEGGILCSKITDTSHDAKHVVEYNGHNILPPINLAIRAIFIFFWRCH